MEKTYKCKNGHRFKNEEADAVICPKCNEPAELIKWNTFDGFNSNKNDIDLTHEAKSATAEIKVEKKPEKKESIFKTIVIIIAVVLALRGGRYLMNQFYNSTYAVDKDLAKFSSEISKNLPIMLDRDTRLDSTMAVPGKTILNSYTLVNYSKDQINLEEFKRNVYPHLVNGLKSSSDFKPFRTAKVSVIYIYKDKNGNEVMKFTVDYNDYKE